MSDIFREIDEEVRREKWQKVWDRYQNYIVGVVFLIVLGVAGWRGYDYLQTEKAAESGTAFEAASRLADEGKHSEAEAAFAKVAAEGTAGYRAFAELRETAELAMTDPKAAIARYQKLAADASIGRNLQDLAAVRAGSLQIDAGSFADAKATLEPVSGDDRTFRHSARELLVIGAWRAGDTAEATRWVNMLTADPQTPQAVRTRIEMFNALIAAESKS